MKFPDKWWTSPAESEAGKTVIITGRDGLEKVQASGKYIYRLDVSWDYEPEASGMPSDADARIMEEATDALLKVFDKNTAAVMTGNIHRRRTPRLDFLLPQPEGVFFLLQQCACRPSGHAFGDFRHRRPGMGGIQRNARQHLHRSRRRIAAATQAVQRN